MVDFTILKGAKIFDGLTEKELEAVAAVVQVKEMISGDPIFNEESEALSLYIVGRGSVEIVKRGSEDESSIAQISAGSHFGEMAFLDRHIRTASAYCRENTQLLEIPYAAMESLLNQNLAIGCKVYRNLAFALARRVRMTTSDLSALKELKLRHI